MMSNDFFCHFMVVNQLLIIVYEPQEESKPVQKKDDLQLHFCSAVSSKGPTSSSQGVVLHTGFFYEIVTNALRL